MAFGRTGLRSGLRRGPGAVTAVVLAGVLALTACGSDDGDPASDSAAAAASGASSGASGVSSAAPADNGDGQASTSGDPSAPADPAAPGSPDGQGPDGAGAAPGDPAAPGAPAPAAGQPAGDDSRQITDLIMGLNGDIPVADAMQYTVDHSCSAYLASRGGRDVLQQQVDALRQTSGGATQGQLANQVTEVRDIRVDGDRATATAVGTVQGQDSTQEVPLQRENGAWTLCPSA